MEQENQTAWDRVDGMSFEGDRFVFDEREEQKPSKRGVDRMKPNDRYSRYSNGGVVGPNSPRPLVGEECRDAAELFASPPKALEQIADVVLNYRPKSKQPKPRKRKKAKVKR